MEFIVDDNDRGLGVSKILGDILQGGWLFGEVDFREIDVRGQEFFGGFAAPEATWFGVNGDGHEPLLTRLRYTLIIPSNEGSFH